MSDIRNRFHEVTVKDSAIVIGAFIGQGQEVEAALPNWYKSLWVKS